MSRQRSRNVLDWLSISTAGFPSVLAAWAGVAREP